MVNLTSLIREKVLVIETVFNQQQTLEEEKDAKYQENALNAENVVRKVHFSKQEVLINVQKNHQQHGTINEKMKKLQNKQGMHFAQR